MKIFLVRVTVYDGEHEHNDYGLIKAKDQNTALEIAKKETHSLGEEEIEQKYWSYGDGETFSTLKDIQEISQDEAAVLTKLNIVHFLN